MRNNVVSISKAIAIILMVLAHTDCSNFCIGLISLFHMPLFFFFSGYCFKEKNLSNSKLYLKKRVKALYIPFVKWSLIFLLCHNIFYILHLYDVYYPPKIIASKAAHIITAMIDMDPLLGGFWFLRCMFWSSLIAFFLLKFIDRFITLELQRFFLLSTGLGILLFTMIFSYYNLYIPYFYVGEKEFLGAFFFISGVFIRRYPIVLNKKLLFTMICIVILFLGALLWPCSMRTLQYHIVFVYVISAFSGIWICYHVSCFIAKTKISNLMIYVGDNTLAILIWHFLSFKLVTLLIVRICGLDIDYLASFPVISNLSQRGFWILYLIVGVILPMLLSKINFLKK